jgi:prepilin-type N-terminal cleavage/methylation domain-containing protein
VNTNRNWITRLLLCSHRNRKNRTDMKINTSRKSGFTLVEIMIVVAIIGLLAAIAIPNFVKARATSQTNACINNLRQIDSAVQQWALEKGKAETSAIASSDEADIWVYIKGGTSNCVCPVNRSLYTLPSSVSNTPACPNVSTVPDHVLN